METTKIVAPYYRYKQEAYRFLAGLARGLVSKAAVKTLFGVPDECFVFFRTKSAEEEYLQVWFLKAGLSKEPLNLTKEDMLFTLGINVEDGRILSDVKGVPKYLSESNFEKFHEALENIYSVGDETNKFELSDIFKGSVESVVITSEYIGITLDTNVVFLSRGIEV